jgi:hypothetical protein
MAVMRVPARGIGGARGGNDARTCGRGRLQLFAVPGLLCAFGSAGGIVLGSLATGLYAYARQWPTVVPATASRSPW